jgi:hypothetical protein
MAGFFSPSIAHAAPGWTSVSPVATVISDEVGLTIILPNANNPMSCSSGNWYRLAATTANYQVTAASLLSAAAQNKQVQVWATSCAADGRSLIVAAWSVS